MSGLDLKEEEGGQLAEDEGLDEVGHLGAADPSVVDIQGDHGEG